MTTTDQPSRRTTVAGDAALTAVFAAGLAGTAWALSDSWGGGSWLFGLGAGTAVCVLALARRIHRVWTAAAGVSIGAAAIAISQAADLPREPAPAMALALAVLVGSAIRWLPASAAAAIGGGGFAVVVGAWLPGEASVVALANTAAWLAAVGVGMSLRLTRPVPPGSVA